MCANNNELDDKTRTDAREFLQMEFTRWKDAEIDILDDHDGEDETHAASDEPD